MPLSPELLAEISDSGRSQITRALVRIKQVINSSRYSDAQKAEAQEYADALTERLEAIEIEESDAALDAAIADTVSIVNEAD